MIQLALETTGKNGSLAVLDGENLLWHQQFGLQRRTAAELAVGLQSALQWCEEQTPGLDGIAVAVGPGSFTGLRIAVTAAKTLGYATNLPIVPVGSLIAIAATVGLEPEQSKVLVGINAYRGQVFAAEFGRQELLEPREIVSCNHRAEILTRSQWDVRVDQALGRTDCAIASDRAIFSGGNADRLASRARPDAAGVGVVAARLLADSESPARMSSAEDVRKDPFSLSVRYLKPSAAEEQAASSH